MDPTLSGTYSLFATAPASAPPQAVTAQVRVTATSNSPATVCLDDLALDGPAYAVPSPTSMPSPTLTPTPPPPTAASAASPAPTSTGTPASTRTPSPTQTQGGAGAAVPSPAPGTAGASALTGGDFVNGGFESGLAGWLKFGGDLRVVGSPVHGGSSAGALVSATTSTKWAYQAVAVNPGGAYELRGYLLPGGGVEEAYLRISWYGSTDASGRTLGSVDSTERLAGGAAAYRALTTGSVQAPPEARSARVRVMLAPVGAANATLYMDDIAFGPAAEAPRAAPLVAAGEELQEDAAPGLAVPRPSSGGDPSQAGSAGGTSAATAASGTQPLSSPASPDRATPAAADRRGAREDGGSPWLWTLLGAALFAGAFGAAYAIAKRRRHGPG